MIYYLLLIFVCGRRKGNRQCLCLFSPAVEKLEVVECDLEKKDSIQPALGNASVVICCIGASEKEISDITGPYRIDYLATKNLVDAGKPNKKTIHSQRCLFIGLSYYLSCFIVSLCLCYEQQHLQKLITSSW